MSTRTIRPARPVSGAAQSNLSLGAPIRGQSALVASEQGGATLRPMLEESPASSEMYSDAPASADANSRSSMHVPAVQVTQSDADEGMSTAVALRRTSYAHGQGPPPLAPMTPSSSSSHMAVAQHTSSPAPLMPESHSMQNMELRPRAMPPSGPRSQPGPRPPAPAMDDTQAADAGPDTRLRGLRKWFAMMTCGSSSSTVAAAVDGHDKKTPSLPPSASHRRSTLPATPADELHAAETVPMKTPSMRASTHMGDSSANMADTTRNSAVLTVPSAGNRSSMATSAGSSDMTDDLDDFSQDIITQVPQNGMPVAAGYIDPELEQEMIAEEQQLIQQGGLGIPVDEYGQPCPLLVPATGLEASRKCLVLDLDETLVHSSFKMVPNADFVVPVEIEGVVHNVYVIKRPGVDEFMRLMGQLYEVVIFTASLNKYADPVIDILDIHQVVRHRLFRESCYNHHGTYVKDLSQLGRPLNDTIILDNSPASYIFHPTNAVPVSSWFNDPHDTELTDLCPFLEDLCAVEDVRIVLDGFIDLL